MSKSYELIKKIISEQKYKLVEDDGESFMIRYQMNAIRICPNSEDDAFVSVILSNFAVVTEENFAEVVMRCHKLNEQMKQVKFYTVNDVVIAASEFYYLAEDDLSFQINQAMNSLIAAKVNYKKNREIRKNMENIKELKSKYNCQNTKDGINGSLKDYTEFVDICLEREDFVKAMNKLLPFDNVVQAKLKIVDDASPVKSLGLSIMRMEPELPLFSLGISIEIAGSKDNKAVNSTTFISACRTIEELREYVKSDAFSLQIKKIFEKQIEDSFSSQNEGS